MLVEVDDRVTEPLSQPCGPHGSERRAVLDQPALGAVPPDEMRNPVDVGVPAGGDRGEAHRGERREGRRRAAVAPVVEQEPERRASRSPRALLDGVRPSITTRTTGLPRGALSSHERGCAGPRAGQAPGSGAAARAPAAQSLRGSPRPARTRAGLARAPPRTDVEREPEHAGASTTERAGDHRGSADRSGDSPHTARDCLLPAPDEPAGDDSARDDHGRQRPATIATAARFRPRGPQRRPRGRQRGRSNTRRPFAGQCRRLIPN